MRVARWRNSLAVRLPASVVEALDLKGGEDIEILVVGSRSLQVRKCRVEPVTLLAECRVSHSEDRHHGLRIKRALKVTNQFR